MQGSQFVTHNRFGINPLESSSRGVVVRRLLTGLLFLVIPAATQDTETRLWPILMETGSRMCWSKGEWAWQFLSTDRKSAQYVKVSNLFRVGRWL